jgi:hypothetical protein
MLTNGDPAESQLWAREALPPSARQRKTSTAPRRILVFVRIRVGAVLVWGMSTCEHSLYKKKRRVLFDMQLLWFLVGTMPEKVAVLGWPFCWQKVDPKVLISIPSVCIISWVITSSQRKDETTDSTQLTQKRYKLHVAKQLDAQDFRIWRPARCIPAGQIL